jgi:class 3 adenylate cyclase
LLLGLFFESRVGWRRWAVTLAVASVAIGVGFLLFESFRYYRGLSGLNYAAFVMGLSTLRPRAAAVLETSKAFLKRFASRYDIPTSPYYITSDLAQAEAYIARRGKPVVVKADGLCAGKGVVVTSKRDEACLAARRMLVDGAFGDAGVHAQLAAATAAKMVVKLEELNKIWQADGLPELNIGIGINTGDAVFGNLGAGKKIEFTVLGDTVNVASRLEALNKEFKTRVILSEATCDQLGEESDVRMLQEITIRGRETSTKIFELISVKEGGRIYETQPKLAPPA